MNRKTVLSILVLAAIVAALPAWAVKPIVKTVPWVPGDASKPHDTFASKQIYLKATTDVQGANFQYMWDFGDGSPVTGWATVTDKYNIGVAKTYAGPIGTPFTATVTVRDTTSGESTSAKYFTAMRDKTLPVEVNVAIDNALWYLHTTMVNRAGAGDTISGNWTGSYNGAGYPGGIAVGLNAFEVNGHSPDPDLANPNPYAETTMRALNWLLGNLSSTSIPNTVTHTHADNSTVAADVDQNNNTIALYPPTTDPLYQTGMIMDALVATGQPSRIAKVGNATYVNGKTLKDVVQDLADYVAYCQHPNGYYAGGWRYGCQGGADNSFNQWNAIGTLAAIRNANPAKDFGAVVDPDVAKLNLEWVGRSQAAAGYFGYDGTGYLSGWGPFAVTPSGMVQLVLSGIGRGDPRWDRTEAWIRSQFDSTVQSNDSNIKWYYYGLFSFTKSMLLHDNRNNTSVGTNPQGQYKLDQLCGRDGAGNLTNCIDWYWAEKSAGDSADGVARSLVNTQYIQGLWDGAHEYCCGQEYFETAWATIMLNRTVFETGLPVAVIDASPTIVANGGTVTFTGKNSFHQDPSHNIVKWDWDFTGGTAFTATGVNQSKAFTDPGPYPVSKKVRLRVTDDSLPPKTADAIITITIAGPPIAPTAFAGGPYNICPQPAYLPFYLNGTGSVNPDDGKTDGSVGSEPDKITGYDWDLDSNNTYGDRTGAQPRVDDFYASAGMLGNGQILNVGLRVTDNTAKAFPTSGLPNLSSTALAQVFLRTAADPFCSKCVTTAQALGKGASGTAPAMVQLVWKETGADHYNIYRSLNNGGPYTLVGSVKNIFLNIGKNLAFSDKSVVAGTTYYYRIAPATLNDTETCQSNQTFVVAVPRIR